MEEKSILSEEQKYLEGTLSNLIGRHNVLCDIEHVFDNDVLAYEYFDRARSEVLNSGNQSYSAMLVLTLTNMLEYIRDHEKEENTDIEKLQSRIRDLELENRVLKNKLETIKKLALIGLNEG